MNEDTIDLDVICAEEAKKFRTGSLKEADSMALYLRNVMTEAIHQALVLASERVKATAHENPDDYGTGEIWAEVDKNSILQVERLIV